MMPLVIVIQNLKNTLELVNDTVWRDIVYIKKVTPLASSNDATTDSDTIFYDVGIGM